MNRFKIYKSGITLIELIISLGILSIILATAYSMNIFGNKEFKNSSDKANVQSSFRIAESYITKQLRYAGNITILSSMPASPASGIQYIYVDTASRMLKHFDGTTAKDIPGSAGIKISALDFQRFDDNTIKYGINGASNAEMFQFLSAVSLLNNTILPAVPTDGPVISFKTGDFITLHVGASTPPPAPPPPPPPAPVPAPAISITPQYDVVFRKSATINVSADINPACAGSWSLISTTPGVPVNGMNISPTSFSSSTNTSAVLQIASSGTSLHEVEVSVTAGSTTENKTITIIPCISSVYIDGPNHDKLNRGNTDYLTLTVEDEYHAVHTASLSCGIIPESITWSSNNSNITCTNFTSNRIAITATGNKGAQTTFKCQFTKIDGTTGSMEKTITIN